MPLPAQQTCGAGARLLCSIHKLFLHPYYVQAPQGHQESVGGKGDKVWLLSLKSRPMEVMNV